MDKIKRADFISGFVAAGLKYTQAEKAYDAMIATLGRGISGRAKIHFSSVGALVPTAAPSRTVSMGFEPGGGQGNGSRRLYMLGERTRYKFKIHEAFGRDHDLCP